MDRRDVAHVFPLYSKMSFADKLIFKAINFVDRHWTWYRLPVFLGLAYLAFRRGLHQRYSLLDVSSTIASSSSNDGGDDDDDNDRGAPKYRTADGRLNDPLNPRAGSKGSFFGRNMSPEDGQFHTSFKQDILDPHPTLVASKLLARTKLVDTGTQFNMLAASWIQFMIHDWIDHLEDTKQIELVAPTSIASSCPLQRYQFFLLKGFPATSGLERPIHEGYPNIRTSWWDGSGIYGNDKRDLQNVRTFRGGKLILSNDGLPEYDVEGRPIFGDIRNTWKGIEVLQALFVKEHNVVCDMIKHNHPNFDDEEIFRRARLVISAIIAKIHTIDWTVELLKMDTLHVAMRSNWYGLLGKRFKELFGHTGVEILSGYVGMRKTENHGVPYSLTEDFVSVYRMHSLLPDAIVVRDINKRNYSQSRVPPLLQEVPMPELLGARGNEILASIGIESMLASMGHQACGALNLWNYPMWLRDLIPQDPEGRDRKDPVDLPSLEIYRDRERRVPRYNAFRRNLLLLPISKWEDLTQDKDAISTLEEVYGRDVEKLDLLVGMMAEKKPTGFAISETAFIIFLLMASRRLEADRFFTSDFKEHVYTKEGLEWVNRTEGLKDVLARHHPEMVDNWLSPGISAFSVWSAKPKDSCNLVPIYFRIP